MNWVSQQMRSEIVVDVKLRGLERAQVAVDGRGVRWLRGNQTLIEEFPVEGGNHRANRRNIGAVLNRQRRGGLNRGFATEEPRPEFGPRAFQGVVAAAVEVDYDRLAVNGFVDDLISQHAIGF